MISRRVVAFDPDPGVLRALTTLFEEVEEIDLVVTRDAEQALRLVELLSAGMVLSPHLELLEQAHRALPEARCLMMADDGSTASGGFEVITRPWNALRLRAHLLETLSESINAVELDRARTELQLGDDVEGPLDALIEQQLVDEISAGRVRNGLASERSLIALVRDFGGLPDDQLDAAIEAHGDGTDPMRLTEMATSGLIDELAFLRALAIKSGTRFIDPSTVVPELTVLGECSFRTLRSWHALPLGAIDDFFPVLIGRPMDGELAQQLEGALGHAPTPIYCDADHLDPVIAELAAIVDGGVLDRVRKRIDRGEIKLPAVPSLLIRIQRALADDTTTAAQIAELIRSEPALATTVVRLANSASMSARYPVSDIRQAVVRIGLRQIRTVVTAHCLQDRFRLGSRTHVAMLDQLWDHAIAKAAACRAIAERVGADPEEAFLIGILHSTGRLAVLKVVDELAARKGEPPLSAYAVRVLIEYLHDQVGLRLLEEWNLPEELATAIAEAGQPIARHTTKLSTIVRASEAATRDSGMHPLPSFGIPLHEHPSIKALGLSASDVTALRCEITALVRTLRDVFELAG